MIDEESEGRVSVDDAKIFIKKSKKVIKVGRIWYRYEKRGEKRDVRMRRTNGARGLRK